MSTKSSDSLRYDSIIALLTAAKRPIDRSTVSEVSPRRTSGFGFSALFGFRPLGLRRRSARCSRCSSRLLIAVLPSSFLRHPQCLCKPLLRPLTGVTTNGPYSPSQEHYRTAGSDAHIRHSVFAPLRQFAAERQLYARKQRTHSRIVPLSSQESESEFDAAD